MNEEDAPRRECRDCSWWESLQCRMGSQARPARERAPCEDFIRRTLHMAFFIKI